MQIVEKDIDLNLNSFKSQASNFKLMEDIIEQELA
jgi:hypothetical protein